MISSSSQKESCVPTFKLQLFYLHFLKFSSKFQRFSRLNCAAPRAPGRQLVRALPEAARGRHVAGERQRPAQASQSHGSRASLPCAHASSLVQSLRAFLLALSASPLDAPSWRAVLRHWPSRRTPGSAPPQRGFASATRQEPLQRISTRPRLNLARPTTASAWPGARRRARGDLRV